MPNNHERSKEYYAIAMALASDFESIYYVNIETDKYTEFTKQGAYEDLQIELSGTNFFEECQRNLLNVVYSEDQAVLSAALEKELLLETLRTNHVFHIVYRLVIDGKPVYYRMKVVMDEEQENVVIGVSNVDNQIRGEQDLAATREKANRDALTGVKSKHAYMDDVEKINREIADQTIQEFAVAVCDVNGLKSVNDTQGHQAGDKLIKDACHIICEIFRHSPVYRTGGDEFVAILRGHDYQEQNRLISEMNEINKKNRESGDVIIACGTSKWDSENDISFDAVFSRADAEMYENKSRLKDGIAE